MLLLPMLVRAGRLGQLARKNIDAGCVIFFAPVCPDFPKLYFLVAR